MNDRVLLVEPERALSDALRAGLESAGFRVTTAESAAEAFEAASRGHFDTAVLEIRLLGREEASLLHFLRSRSPAGRIIILSGPDEAEAALRASQQAGALSMLKPVKPEDLAAVVKRLQAATVAEESAPAEDDEKPFAFHGIVGRSLALRKVIRLAAKVAPTDSTVIITGETGTGKEMVARVIHQLSRRAERPMVTVNCGAIPENLIESELFGHKRGAFTDAVADKKGLLEMAHQGTILLDEVGELTPAAQVKLLRAIEEMEIRRVGDSAVIRVDVRVLAATNRDLETAVRAGKFREDLWFRLNVVTIHLSPLRERREDIPALLSWFLAEATRKFEKSVVAVAPDALAVIGRYDFPGNVRELRNIVEHAVVMADKATIRVEDLPPHVVAAASKQRLLAQPESVGAPVAAGASEVGAGDFKTIAEAERELIQWTLERLEGNQTEAAKHLGISRSTLWRKIKEYKLNV